MTRRPLLVLAASAALAAWVSAQTGTGPTAADSLRMLKLNRGLYEDLTAHALALGERHTALDRADECRRVADRLGREVQDAARLNNPDRVAEVGDHLGAVVADGLVPNLTDARDGISPKSPEFKRLQDVHREAFDGLTRTVNAIPTDGEVGASAKVQAAREKLAAATARIGPPPDGK